MGNGCEGKGYFTVFFEWKIHLTGVDKFGSGFAMATVRNMNGNFF